MDIRRSYGNGDLSSGEAQRLHSIQPDDLDQRVMKLRVTQEHSSTLVRREFVQGCFAAMICATGTINAELKMKTMATKKNSSIERAAT